MLCSVDVKCQMGVATWQRAEHQSPQVYRARSPQGALCLALCCKLSDQRGLYFDFLSGILNGVALGLESLKIMVTPVHSVQMWGQTVCQALGRSVSVRKMDRARLGHLALYLAWVFWVGFFFFSFFKMGKMIHVWKGVLRVWTILWGSQRWWQGS